MTLFSVSSNKERCRRCSTIYLIWLSVHTRVETVWETNTSPGNRILFTDGAWVLLFLCTVCAGNPRHEAEFASWALGLVCWSYIFIHSAFSVVFPFTLCVCMCVQECISVCVHVYMCVCMHRCVCMFVYACACVFFYPCMCWSLNWCQVSSCIIRHLVFETESLTDPGVYLPLAGQQRPQDVPDSSVPPVLALQMCSMGAKGSCLQSKHFIHGPTALAPNP